LNTETNPATEAQSAQRNLRQEEGHADTPVGAPAAWSSRVALRATPTGCSVTRSAGSVPPWRSASSVVGFFVAEIDVVGLQAAGYAPLMDDPVV
jgi:hypothetical protein